MPWEPPATDGKYGDYRDTQERRRREQEEDTGDGGGGGDGGDDDNGQPENNYQELIALIRARFPWLEQLPGIFKLIRERVIDDIPEELIVEEVRDTEVYKKRFAGMLGRAEKGLPQITEAEYLNTEEAIMEQLEQFKVRGVLGLQGISKFRAFAADMIGKDVSVQELNRRLDFGTAIAREVAPRVRSAFQRFYGVEPTEDALLLWALDAEQGIQEIENQIMSARIGSEALRFGLNITRRRAELLEAEGVDAQLAAQGFADVAREQGTLARLAEIHDIDPLSQRELEEFFFHEDPEVAQQRSRIFNQALAEFRAGGPARTTREGGLAALVEREQAI